MPSAKECMEGITMTVDEYETIKLIDNDGLDQRGCALRMGVARTTVQAIYTSARKKLAEFLCGGKRLHIEGGDYYPCNGRAMECVQYHKEKNSMNKIAVTYENGNVFPHFGHTEQFKVYDVEGGKVVKSEIVGSDGQGHGALANLLANHKVDTLVCGGIGGGARNMLAQVGITLYPGVEGDADKAVSDLLAGKLQYDPDFVCAHHEQHEGGCGEHHDEGCGEHHCGQ
jgi:predicted Fe-Mo cluster-binding NifX family protein/predicted DNA-binding protein (UPF0251 family)